MSITFLRHAQVIKEYQGKYNGHIDIALSNKGEQDAKNLGFILQSKKFDKVYCSDLQRCTRTLQLLSLHIPTIITPQLREKSWGRHEGKSFAEIVAEEKLVYTNFLKWISDLDGEPYKLYSTRLFKYFENTILKESEKNILIVTHSGVIKTLLSKIHNISLEEAFMQELPYSSYITL